MRFLSSIEHPEWLLGRSLILFVVLIAACTPTAAELQDKNWTTSSELIDTSDRIIMSRFVDSRVETVQLVEAGTGAFSGETDVLFRQFETVESFKGTSDPGDSLWIAFEPGRAGQLVDGWGAVKNFTVTGTYVLFLKGRLRPLEYPPDIGAVLWSGNGEPAFAEVVSDRMEFRAERFYLDLLNSEERGLPDARSASPFSLTLDQLREAAK